LKTLGIEKMFSGDAEFGNIAEEVYVSKGIHKTDFQSDENGSKGAAATGFGMMRSTSFERPKPNVNFVADRPYLEAVFHEDTYAILFLNRIDDPR
jgi:serpin B